LSERCTPAVLEGSASTGADPDAFVTAGPDDLPDSSQWQSY